MRKCGRWAGETDIRFISRAFRRSLFISFIAVFLGGTAFSANFEPAIGNIDDGTLSGALGNEFVTVSDDGRLFAWKDDSTLLNENWPIALSSQERFSSSPILVSWDDLNPQEKKVLIFSEDVFGKSRLRVYGKDGADVSAGAQNDFHVIGKPVFFRNSDQQKYLIVCVKKSSGYSVVFYLLNNDASLTYSDGISMSGLPLFTVGDINNDGKQEVLIINSVSGQFFYRQIGSGSFSVPASVLKLMNVNKTVTAAPIVVEKDSVRYFALITQSGEIHLVNENADLSTSIQGSFIKSLKYVRWGASTSDHYLVAINDANKLTAISFDGTVLNPRIDHSISKASFHNLIVNDASLKSDEVLQTDSLISSYGFVSSMQLFNDGGSVGADEQGNFKHNLLFNVVEDTQVIGKKIFSPNGDGYNDYITLGFYRHFKNVKTGSYLFNETLVISDSFGNTIVSLSPQIDERYSEGWSTFQWDGKNTGVTVSDGIYQYEYTVVVGIGDSVATMRTLETKKIRGSLRVDTQSAVLVTSMQSMMINSKVSPVVPLDISLAINDTQSDAFSGTIYVMKQGTSLITKSIPINGSLINDGSGNYRAVAHYYWDGKDNDGQIAKPGSYSISVELFDQAHNLVNYNSTLENKYILLDTAGVAIDDLSVFCSPFIFSPTATANNSTALNFSIKQYLIENNNLSMPEHYYKVSVAVNVLDNTGKKIGTAFQVVDFDLRTSSLEYNNLKFKIPWSGKINNAIVPTGDYALEILLTDTFGNSVIKKTPVVVDASQCLISEVKVNNGQLEVYGTAANRLAFSYYELDYKLATESTWRSLPVPSERQSPSDSEYPNSKRSYVHANNTLLGRVSTFGLSSGAYKIRLTVCKGTEEHEIYTSDYSLENTAQIRNYAISSEMLQYNSVKSSVSISYESSQNAQYTIRIKDGFSTIRTLTGEGSGIVSVQWDGKKDDGNNLPNQDKEYTVETVVSASGKTVFSDNSKKILFLSAPVSANSDVVLAAPTVNASGSVVPKNGKYVQWKMTGRGIQTPPVGYNVKANPSGAQRVPSFPKATVRFSVMKTYTKLRIDKIERIYWVKVNSMFGGDSEELHYLENIVSKTIDLETVGIQAASDIGIDLRNTFDIFKDNFGPEDITDIKLQVVSVKYKNQDITSLFLPYCPAPVLHDNNSDNDPHLNGNAFIAPGIGLASAGALAGAGAGLMALIGSQVVWMTTIYPATGAIAASAAPIVSFGVSAAAPTLTASQLAAGSGVLAISGPGLITAGVVVGAIAVTAFILWGVLQPNVTVDVDMRLGLNMIVTPPVGVDKWNYMIGKYQAIYVKEINCAAGIVQLINFDELFEINNDDTGALSGIKYQLKITDANDLTLYDVIKYDGSKFSPSIGNSVTLEETSDIQNANQYNKIYYQTKDVTGNILLSPKGTPLVKVKNTMIIDDLIPWPVSSIEQYQILNPNGYFTQNGEVPIYDDNNQIKLVQLPQVDKDKISISGEIDASHSTVIDSIRTFANQNGVDIQNSLNNFDVQYKKISVNGKLISDDPTVADSFYVTKEKAQSGDDFKLSIFTTQSKEYQLPGIQNHRFIADEDLISQPLVINIANDGRFNDGAPGAIPGDVSLFEMNADMTEESGKSSLGYSFNALNKTITINNLGDNIKKILPLYGNAKGAGFSGYSIELGFRGSDPGNVPSRWEYLKIGSGGYAQQSSCSVDNGLLGSIDFTSRQEGFYSVVLRGAYKDGNGELQYATDVKEILYNTPISIANVSFYPQPQNGIIGIDFAAEALSVNYSLSESSKQVGTEGGVNYSIYRDSDNALIYSRNTDGNYGQNTFDWNGNDISGTPVPRDQSYYLVIKAQDIGNKNVPGFANTKSIAIIQPHDLPMQGSIAAVNPRELEIIDGLGPVVRNITCEYSLVKDSPVNKIRLVIANKSNPSIPIRILSAEQTKGNHVIKWDCLGENKTLVPAGTYEIGLCVNESGIDRFLDKDDVSIVILSSGNLIANLDVDSAVVPKEGNYFSWEAEVAGKKASILKANVATKVKTIAHPTIPFNVRLQAFISRKNWYLQRTKITASASRGGGGSAGTQTDSKYGYPLTQDSTAYGVQHYGSDGGDGWLCDNTYSASTSHENGQSTKTRVLTPNGQDFILHYPGGFTLSPIYNAYITATASTADNCDGSDPSAHATISCDVDEAAYGSAERESQIVEKNNTYMLKYLSQYNDYVLADANSNYVGLNIPIYFNAPMHATTAGTTFVKPGYDPSGYFYYYDSAPEIGINSTWTVNGVDSPLVSIVDSIAGVNGAFSGNPQLNAYIEAPLLGAIRRNVNDYYHIYVGKIFNGYASYDFYSEDQSENAEGAIGSPPGSSELAKNDLFHYWNPFEFPLSYGYSGFSSIPTCESIYSITGELLDNEQKGHVAVEFRDSTGAVGSATKDINSTLILTADDSYVSTYNDVLHGFSEIPYNSSSTVIPINIFEGQSGNPEKGYATGNKIQEVKIDQIKRLTLKKNDQIIAEINNGRISKNSGGIRFANIKTGSILGENNDLGSFFPGEDALFKKSYNYFETFGVVPNGELTRRYVEVKGEAGSSISGETVSYRVRTGRGVNPLTWETIAEGQNKSGTLAYFDIGDLYGEYTILLEVYKKNLLGVVTEKRTKTNIISIGTFVDASQNAVATTPNKRSSIMFPKGSFIIGDTIYLNNSTGTCIDAVVYGAYNQAHYPNYPNNQFSGVTYNQDEVMNGVALERTALGAAVPRDDIKQNYLILAKKSDVIPGSSSRVHVDSAIYIQINKVFYGDHHAQFIELYNPLATVVDISGFVIGNGYGEIKLPAGTSIQPRGFIVIAKSSEALQAKFGRAADIEWDALSYNGYDDVVSVNALDLNPNKPAYRLHINGNRYQYVSIIPIPSTSIVDYLDNGQVVLGQLYDFKPDNVTFNESVKPIVTYTGSLSEINNVDPQTLGIYYVNSKNVAEFLPSSSVVTYDSDGDGTKDSYSITAQVNHFSQYGLIADTSKPLYPIVDAIISPTKISLHTIKGTTSPNVDVTVYLNSAIAGKMRSDNNGLFSSSIAFVNKNNELRIVATDTKNNNSDPYITNIVFDVVPPSITNSIALQNNFNPVGTSSIASGSVVLQLSEEAAADIYISGNSGIIRTLSVLSYSNIHNGTFSLDCNWDGKKSDGVFASEGVYTYRIILRDKAGNISQDGVFHYGRFVIDQNPPSFIVNQICTRLSPNGDGLQDEAAVEVICGDNFSETNALYCSILDKNNSTIKTIYQAQPYVGKRLIRWDGTDERNVVVPTDSYSMSISAFDEAKNRSAVKIVPLEVKTATLHVDSFRSGKIHYKAYDPIHALFSSSEQYAFSANMSQASGQLISKNNGISIIGENKTTIFTGFLAEGEYHIACDFKDTYGNALSAEVPIWIDNTKPLIKIDDINTTQLSAGILSIYGTVSDVHLSNFTVALEDIDAQDLAGSRTTYLSGNRSIVDNKIGTLPLDGKQGQYRIVISAYDMASNYVEEKSEPLQINVPSQLFIVYADELVIRDSLSLFYKIATNATVVGELYSDEISSAFIAEVYRNSSAIGMGVVSTSIANLQLPSGRYRLRMAALDTGNQAVLGERNITVYIDNIAPNIIVTSPVNNLISTTNFVIAGNVIEDHFAAMNAMYSVYPNTQWIDLTKSLQMSGNGQFSLVVPTGIGSELIKIKLNAIDSTFNSAEKTLEYTVDNAPLVIKINELPVVIGRSAIVIGEVSGSGFEKHNVSIKNITSQAVYAGQDHYSRDINEPVSFNGISDGQYTICVTAQKKSGISYSALSPIEVDLTPPSITIDNSEDLLDVGGVLTIRGSILDNNFYKADVYLSEQNNTSFSMVGAVKNATEHGVLASVDVGSMTGARRVKISAEDMAGNKSESIIPIFVSGDSPIAQLNQTFNYKSVAGRFSIIGTAAGKSMRSYILSLVEDSKNVTNVLRQGNESINEAEIFSLNTVSLANTNYTLVLMVENTRGNKQYAFLRFTVDNADFKLKYHTALPEYFNPLGTVNTATLISYQFTKPSIVDLYVTDAQGRMIKTILEGVNRSGNAMTEYWDGRDSLRNFVPEGTYTLCIIGHDDVGNTVENVTHAMIDMNRPTANIAFSHAPYINGNNKYISSQNRIRVSGSDSFSGIASISLMVNDIDYSSRANDFTIANDGNYTMQYYVEDNARNRSTTQSESVIVDATPPIADITCNFPLVKIDNNTYADVSWRYKIVASDSGSGIQRILLDNNQGDYSEYNGNEFTFSTGVNVIRYKALDNVGNEVVRSITITTPIPDITPPVSVITPSTSLYSFMNKSYASGTTTYSINANDIIGQNDGMASGVDHSKYRIDGGAWLTYATPINLNEGAHVFEYYSVDKIGNAETVKSYPINVDATSPITSASIINDSVIAPALDVNFINSQSVSLSLSALDPVSKDVSSGVKRIEYRLPNGDWMEYMAPVVLNNLTTAPYIISYRSTDNVNNTESLKSLTIIKDITPPIVTINNVISGGYYKPGVSVTFNVEEANIAGIVATIDGNPYVSGMPITAEGTHTLTVTAVDKAGNQGTKSATFIIDGTAPIVSISQVASGGYYKTGIAPVYSVHDDNIQTVSASLNGAAYSSGTPITIDGAYTLQVTATDKADNSVVQSVSFTVDGTPPVITISQVETGGYYKPGISASFSTVEANIAAINATLDGIPYTSGTSIAVEGAHTLIVVAHDKAGNQDTKTVTFIVDGTLPVISIANVTNAGFYKAGLAPAYTATDLNLFAVNATLNGASYTAGTPITADGTYALQVSAIDKANNIAAQTVSFTVDGTPPAVTISGISNGAFYLVPVAAQVAISDLNLHASTVTLNGNPYVSGTLISGEGKQIIFATAQDKAGNETTKSVSFDIDTQGPRISITGAENGGYYRPTLNVFYTAEDVNLISLSAKLDNKNYISGDPITKNGSHTLTVTAKDKFGRVTTKTLTFTIDGKEPIVVVAGVADGKYYRHSVMPIVLIHDENLSNKTVTLNGNPYTPKTWIKADGNYTLVADAVDKAGNRKTVTVKFVIDTKDPVITISGISDDVSYTNAVTPVITVTDENIDLTKTILVRCGKDDHRKHNCHDHHCGDAFVPGTTITNDGAYLLIVFAKDKADNSTAKSVSFSVDTQSPEITISGISDGGYYKPNTAVSFSANDVNLVSCTATLDGVAYLSGTPVRNNGVHTLVVKAADKAGHVTIKAVTFTIDGIQPIVSITGVDNEGFYMPSIAPNVSVIDMNLLSSTVTLDNVPYTSGTAITAEGVHTLNAYGVDRAGNFAAKTIKFTIDGTTPAITISGAENNSVYNRTVTVDVSVYDANLKRTYITLDNVPTTSHIVVSSEGAHTVHVEADDKAGNRSMKDISFVIDKTLPVVLIEGIVNNGTYTKATIGVKLYEDNYDATRTSFKLDTQEYAQTITNGVDSSGARFYGLSIANITNTGAHTIVYSVTDKAGNKVSGSIAFTITPFDMNADRSFYANFDSSTKATYAKGDKDDYSGVKVIVSGGYMTNCVAPGVTSGDVVVQYKAQKNMRMDKGTFAIWVKPNWTKPTNSSIVSFGTSSLNKLPLGIYVTKTNETILSISKDNKAKSITATTNWAVNRDWTYIGFTWFSEAKEHGTSEVALSFFINGTVIGTLTMHDPTFDDIYWMLLGYGKPDKSWTTFTGKLDEARVYEKALSADDIKALYESEKVRAVQNGTGGSTKSAQMMSTTTVPEKVIYDERSGNDLVVE